MFIIICMRGGVFQYSTPNNYYVLHCITIYYVGALSRLDYLYKS